MITSRFTNVAVLLVVAACFLTATSLVAAPINYGDFSGLTVDYLQVTETANFPVGVEPKFGAPTIIGDTLDFDPAGFAVTSSGGIPDFMDVQLNFAIMSHIGYAVTNIKVDELGDFSLLGTGTAATEISYALSLASIKVLAVDHVSLTTPVTLDSLSTSGGENLVSSPGSGQTWSLSVDYDVQQALIDEGVSFSLGATKIELALDNTLAALSEASSIAFNAKKDDSGVVITVDTVPEPAGSLFLAGLIAVGANVRRRRNFFRANGSY